MECEKFEECGRRAEFGRLCLVHEKRRRSASASAQVAAHTRAQNAEKASEPKPAKKAASARGRRRGAKTTEARTRKAVPGMQTTDGGAT